jgi:ribose 5-phosphate isomerase B
MIYLASDHRGFELKARIKGWLSEFGYEYEDCGPLELDPDDDYPDYVHVAARKVAEDPGTHKAIVLGMSGQGEAMVANRYQGVRAAVFYGGERSLILLSREHNDANILSLGASFLTVEDAKLTVRKWLETPFSGDERHVRRIKKIDR